MRMCTVCRIRETDDYPFPTTDWDLCWNHGTTRVFVASGRRITQVWDGTCWTTIRDEGAERGSAGLALMLVGAAAGLAGVILPLVSTAVAGLGAAGGAL